MGEAGVRVGLTTVYRALQDVERAGTADVVRSTGFADVEHTLELTGICAGCRSGADDGGPGAPPPF